MLIDQCVVTLTLQYSVGSIRVNISVACKRHIQLNPTGSYKCTINTFMTVQRSSRLKYNPWATVIEYLWQLGS